jgi:hypothetical protein
VLVADVVGVADPHEETQHLGLDQRPDFAEL